MNAGKYNKKIGIYSVKKGEDTAGFPVSIETLVFSCFASVRTTKGFTLIQSGSDFEKAYTNFTIRKPSKAITRDMVVKYAGHTYSIEYLNDINEDGVELEIQTKKVVK
jgi:SPP1 family predicted phage head-tail adaptor